MIYRIEYQLQESPVWLLWEQVEGADAARAVLRDLNSWTRPAATRVLKQDWVPVNLENER